MTGVAVLWAVLIVATGMILAVILPEDETVDDDEFEVPPSFSADLG